MQEIKKEIKVTGMLKSQHQKVVITHSNDITIPLLRKAAKTSENHYIVMITKFEYQIGIKHQKKEIAQQKNVNSHLEHGSPCR